MGRKVSVQLFDAVPLEVPIYVRPDPRQKALVQASNAWKGRADAKPTRDSMAWGGRESVGHCARCGGAHAADAASRATLGERYIAKVMTLDASSNSSRERYLGRQSVAYLR